MSDTIDASTLHEEPAERPAPKRRKIRKGTLSCWECKRRKIRCTFSTIGESKCDGCKSRQVNCIGQEYPDHVKPALDKTNRLNRVETLVDELIRRSDDGISRPLESNLCGLRQEATANLGEEEQDVLAYHGESGRGLQHVEAIADDGAVIYNDVRSELLAAWPTQSQIDILTSVRGQLWTLFHGTVCLPYPQFLAGHLKSPKELLQLPPPGSHPVLIAHKLLLLGSHLQATASHAPESLDFSRVKHHEIMARVIQTATRLVTCNDDLVSSIEGIECIMIESMYYNNAGDLRKAWLTNRRAMLIAQLLGVHLHSHSRSRIIVLDQDTRKRVDPSYMWLRLVSSDRYLSLLLGLPQGSLESDFARADELTSRTPLERLERLETCVGGLILQHRQNREQSLDKALELDKLLQDASASMPAQWWLIPELDTPNGTEADAFNETIRLTNQFAHYHLLAQIHLPYMLQSSSDPKYDYSKIVAANASREILRRFVSFLDSNHITGYCRGIDFLAFIASTTLCLAHIDTRRQIADRQSSGATVFDVLVHQRLTDRGMMERVLQIMQTMDQKCQDIVARRIADVLQRLLAIETAAAGGANYDAKILPNEGAEKLLYESNANDNPDALSISLPHLGTISIESGGLARYTKRPRTVNQENMQRDGTRKSLIESSRDDQNRRDHSISAASHQGRRQLNHDMTFAVPQRPACRSNRTQCSDNAQDISSHNKSARWAVKSQNMISDDSAPFADSFWSGGGDVADMGSFRDQDDWLLQGVDMTLYENLSAGWELEGHPSVFEQ